MDKLLFFSNLHLPNTLKRPHFVIFNQFSAYGIKLQKRSCIRFSVYLAYYSTVLQISVTKVPKNS